MILNIDYKELIIKRLIPPPPIFFLSIDNIIINAQSRFRYISFSYILSRSECAPILMSEL